MTSEWSVLPPATTFVKSYVTSRTLVVLSTASVETSAKHWLQPPSWGRGAMPGQSRGQAEPSGATAVPCPVREIVPLARSSSARPVELRPSAVSTRANRNGTTTYWPNDATVTSAVGEEPPYPAHARPFALAFQDGSRWFDASMRTIGVGPPFTTGTAEPFT